MRCKVGDLAVVVRARDPRNNGALCEVLRTYHNASRPSWYIKASRPLFNFLGMEMTGEIGMYDDCLQPIRDQPGEDETLAWAPVPGKTVEVV